MSKLTTFILLFFALTSCMAQKPKSNTADYWNKPADLTKVTYEGGNGKSVENPISIKNAENERNGIAAEYTYIAKLNGEKFKDWKPAGQSTNTINGRKIDLVKIQTIAKNEIIIYYFDITAFYGK